MKTIKLTGVDRNNGQEIPYLFFINNITHIQELDDATLIFVVGKEYGLPIKEVMRDVLEKIGE